MINRYVIHSLRCLSSGPKIAVIGSGPAGLYTCSALLNRVPECTLHVIDKSTVPYGLVLAGVAPDHADVKKCANQFEKMFNSHSDRLTLFCNVNVGHDVSYRELINNYDAVVLAYGASRARELGLDHSQPENNVYSGFSFVSWYNGQRPDLKPKLDGEDAIVVGNGNVSIDCARILLSDIERFRHTDIAEYAFNSLEQSKIRNVNIIGRRGPLNVSFTIKELRELLTLKNVSSFCEISESIEFEMRKELSHPETSRRNRRLWELMLKHKDVSDTNGKNSIIKFYQRPTRILLDGEGKIERLELENPLTGNKLIVPCSLLIYAIGFQSMHLDGVPVDENNNVMLKDFCRVNEDGALVYATGWCAKAGGGVIADTQRNALLVAEELAADVATIDKKNTKSVDDILKKKHVRYISWQDWKLIDKAEREMGEKKGKSRTIMRRIARTLNTPYDYLLCTYSSIEHTSTPLLRTHPDPESKIKMPFTNPARFIRIRYGLQHLIEKEDLVIDDVIKLMKSYMTLENCEFDALRDVVDNNKSLLDVIKSIAQLAYGVTHSFIKIPILRKRSNESVTLTQRQVSILLAHAFFLTYEEERDRYGRSNCINFTRWYSKRTRNAVEKLNCIFAYFKYVTSHEPSGTISILRQSFPSSFNFAFCDNDLSDMEVDSVTKIEDNLDADHAVFANARIGGGVLRSGCVQEEIRYLIAPECLISCMLCDRMDDDEAVLIVGAEDYSSYTGYGDTFKWVGIDKSDTVKRDSFGHAPSTLVVIDAKNYSKRDNQFSPDFVERELKKAYVGFVVKVNNRETIATGNWGCGAFNGNVYLKFIIQLIAASAASRRLSYHTFGNEELSQRIQQFHGKLKEHHVIVSSLYDALLQADDSIHQDPFTYLTNKLCT
ncbi:unnamed protein product [Bursaphelenchus okinawaensis]|uniref:poly(ADP-ribose) glycohydrolase n=1 Tax=Bursaphelenchus okinawaensis TaxID=465554 RepID=A0A811KWL9_9BILA|nr:unnamed protein product [Bursaphelenchus okinawaensis]CAG9112944.1 unnamed protein product [Bursaphelenchus okinawaensis]